MNKENSIEVKNIKKSFKVYLDKGSELKEKVLFWKRNRYETRWVLNGISFDVKKGEAIGLIGHNGCGKSTTLKLLSKIIYPDSGSIEMSGRVSSLIELGAGFHPDMSGRENIYNNAYIFGLKKKEIDARMDDIIAFSELEKFIDNPVRTYSSGMYMRLAFSVAINVDADILLIDEILAVGDANYQAKCFDRLKEIKKQGTTIVIVSHSLGQIEQICDRTIWIHEGMIRKQGKPRDVHPAYLSFMGEERERIAKKEAERQKRKELEQAQKKGKKVRKLIEQETESVEEKPKAQNTEKNADRYGNQYIEITNVDIKRTDKETGVVFATGDSFDISIDYQVNKTVDSVVFGIAIYRNDDILCYGTNTLLDGVGELDLKKQGTVQFHIEDNSLLDGEYFVDVSVTSDTYLYYDFIRRAKVFYSHSNISDIGVERIKHSWVINKKEYTIQSYQKNRDKNQLQDEITDEEMYQILENSTSNIEFDHNWYEPEMSSDGQIIHTMGRQKASCYIRNYGCPIYFVIAYNGTEKANIVVKTENQTWEYPNLIQEQKEVLYNVTDKDTDKWIRFDIVTNQLWNPSLQSGSIDNRELGAVMLQPQWWKELNEPLERSGLNAILVPDASFLGIADGQQLIRVKVKNTSTEGQIFSPKGNCPVVLSYRVYDLKKKMIYCSQERSYLTKELLPGDSCELEMKISLSDIEDIDSITACWVHVTIVQEGCFWFEDINEEIVAKIYAQ